MTKVEVVAAALAIMGCGKTECHNSVALISKDRFFCAESRKMEVSGNLVYCRCVPPKAEAEGGAK